MNGDDIDEIDDGDEGVLLPWSNFEGIWELFLFFEGIEQNPA